MLNPMEADSFMSTLIEDIKAQQNEVIEKMLGEAIKKGIISIRQSDPVLVLERDPNHENDKIRLMHSVVIDYQGAETIEELEKSLEYMTKINSELHQALSDFYERTKANTWLKSQK